MKIDGTRNEKDEDERDVKGDKSTCEFLPQPIDDDLKSRVENIEASATSFGDALRDLRPGRFERKPKNEDSHQKYHLGNYEPKR